MTGMMRVSHINIVDFYQTDGTGVEFFCLVMPKGQFRFFFELYDLIM